MRRSGPGGPGEPGESVVVAAIVSGDMIVLTPDTGERPRTIAGLYRFR